MKTGCIALFIMIAFTGWSQTFNQKAPDPKKNCELLVGPCTRDGFSTIHSNFDSAFKAEYPLYQPDKETIDQIRNQLEDINITLVMGTWCGDSREWVPRFYKIMDLAGFDYRNLTLICVDRDRKAGDYDISHLKIERVPTFIINRDGQELGRIVEVPDDLLEKDLLKWMMNHQ